MGSGRKGSDAQTAAPCARLRAAPGRAAAAAERALAWPVGGGGAGHGHLPALQGPLAFRLCPLCLLLPARETQIGYPAKDARREGRTTLRSHAAAKDVFQPTRSLCSPRFSLAPGFWPGRLIPSVRRSGEKQRITTASPSLLLTHSRPCWTFAGRRGWGGRASRRARGPGLLRVTTALSGLRDGMTRSPRSTGGAGRMAGSQGGRGLLTLPATTSSRCDPPVCPHLPPAASSKKDAVALCLSKRSFSLQASPKMERTGQQGDRAVAQTRMPSWAARTRSRGEKMRRRRSRGEAESSQAGAEARTPTRLATLGELREPSAPRCRHS